MRKLYDVISIVLFIFTATLVITTLIAAYNKPQQVVNNSTEDLQVLADNKMTELFKTGYWSHTNSDGCDFDCRIRSLRVTHEWVGENLYKNIGETCNISDAYAAWELSPEHKANLDHVQNKSVLEFKQIGNTCYIVLEVANN